MWQAVSHVTSTLTLVAFAIAAATAIVRRWLKGRERQLLTAAVSDRPALIQALNDTFLVPSLPVDPSKLSHDQAYALLLEQIRERSRRFYVTSLLVAFLACVGTVAVCVLYSRGSTGKVADVAPGPGSSPVENSNAETVMELDADTNSAPGLTIAAAPYLHKFGISVSSIDPPTSELVIMNNRAIYGGSAIEPGKSQNVLLQTKTNNVPASFTLAFNEAVAEVTFALPKLYSASGSGVSHPAWKAAALDQDGNELSSQSESLTRSLGDIPLRTYTLRAPAFRKIAAVVFQSDPRLDGVPFAGFSSVVIERLTYRRHS